MRPKSRDIDIGVIFFKLEKEIFKLQKLQHLENAALTMKLSTDFHVLKTHLLLQNIYVIFFYHDMNLIINETV